MRFLRKFKLKDIEIFQLQAKACKGFAIVVDFKRKMEYTDILSNDFFDDEEEFLDSRGYNYVKVFILSDRELLPSEKESTECFFSQLLDGPSDRDWNMEFINVELDEFKYLDYNVYNYCDEFLKKYHISLPKLEINRKIMSYLSQD